MALTIPPKYINTPAPAVLASDIPDSVYRTLALLHGLAWETKGEKTPPATVKELAHVRGLEERQMYRHLKILKTRWIRIENLGDYRIVIYPLRWGREMGAALSEGSELTEEEMAALADEEDSSPTVKNYSRDGPENGSTVKNYSGEGPEDEPTVKNYSSDEEKGGATVKNYSPMFKQHVVVDSCSDSSESKQQHDMGGPTVKNYSSLEQALAAAFEAEGVEPETAIETAADFIRQFGRDPCQAQLDHFARHCELARASPRGLNNPIGLFFRAVQENWRPPVYPTNAGQSRSWYTNEEADLIQR